MRRSSSAHIEEAHRVDARARRRGIPRRGSPADRRAEHPIAVPRLRHPQRIRPAGAMSESSWSAARGRPRRAIAQARGRAPLPAWRTTLATTPPTPAEARLAGGRQPAAAPWTARPSTRHEDARRRTETTPPATTESLSSSPSAGEDVSRRRSVRRCRARRTLRGTPARDGRRPGVIFVPAKGGSELALAQRAALGSTRHPHGARHPTSPDRTLPRALRRPRLVCRRDLDGDRPGRGPPLRRGAGLHPEPADVAADGARRRRGRTVPRATRGGRDLCGRLPCALPRQPRHVRPGDPPEVDHGDARLARDGGRDRGRGRRLPRRLAPRRRDREGAEAGGAAAPQAARRSRTSGSGCCSRTPRVRAGRSGGRSAELAAMFDALDGHPRLGVCLDSCHWWVSGVDVTDPDALDAAMAQPRRDDRPRPSPVPPRQRRGRGSRVEPRPPRVARGRGDRRRPRRRSSPTPPCRASPRSSRPQGPTAPTSGSSRC